MIRGLLAYPAAIGLTAVTLLVRWALDPWLGEAQSLSPLFGAVALAIWWCGLGPALTVAVLGYFASDYLFVAPRGQLGIVGLTGLVSTLTYTAACAAIIGFGEGLRRARRRSTLYARTVEKQTLALERTERHKDEFLATLAHELRNPLAPIMNALDALKGSTPFSPHARRACELIERQVNHMVRLVDDLLDLSRIAEGRLHVHLQRQDLRAVLTSAIELSQHKVESKNHRLMFEKPRDPIWVSGDFTRLVQVYSNLLLNAARYTPDDGIIKVSIWVENDKAAVSVADNGVGIPRAMLSRIFEMYTQAEPSSNSARGLGIGLSLARKLLELHGGTIEARSEGAGKGSEFIVYLPVADSLPVSDIDPAAPEPLARRYRA